LTSSQKLEMKINYPAASGRGIEKHNKKFIRNTTSVKKNRSI